MATYPDGTLLKASGPEIDEMQGGQRRWIPDPATFNYMGLNWGAVQTLSDSDWQQIPKGTPFPSRADGTLLQGSDPKVYVMAGGQRHWIPDPDTFNARGFSSGAVQHVADADLAAIPEGAQLPSVHAILTAEQMATVDQGFIGSGFHMETSAKLVKQTGLLDAMTHTWCTADFVGFTGGVAVWLLDANGIVIATTDVQQFGVDGRDVPFTQSDRLDHWTANIDPNLANQAVSLQIVQLHDPKNRFFTDLNILNEAFSAVKKAVCTDYPAASICALPS